MMKAFRSRSDLSQRVMKSGVWVLFGNSAGQLLRLGGNLVMTRLLAPDLFGVMAVAQFVMFGLALFSDLGLRQNIIQSSRSDEERYLNTAWTLQLVRGMVLWALALLVALGIHFAAQWGLFEAASAYSSPDLPWMIAALGFGVIIQGFGSTKSAMASRNLMLGRITLIEMTGQIVSLVAMLVCGFIFRSVWVLVLASIISETVRTLLSHWAIPGPGNKIDWEPSAAKEILGFGKWIFLTSILGFLSGYGDRMMLGGLLTATLFGLYTQAVMLLAPLQETIQKMISSIAFPAFSEAFRNTPDKLREIYYKFRRPVDIVSLLLAGFMFAAGHLLVALLYDGRYQSAGRILEILSISLFEVRYSVAGQVYMAIGKPNLLTPLILTRVIALFTLMPLLFWIGGTNLAVWMVGGSVLFTIPVNIYFKIKHKIFDLWKELKYLPLVLVGLAVGYSLVYLVGLFS